MKKIVISAFGVCLAALLLLTGCSSVPANRTLSVIWNKSETAVYDAERKIDENTTVKGTLTMKIEKIDQSTVEIGGNPVEVGNNSVNLIATTLRMDNGDSVDVQAVIRNTFKPVASYRKTVIDGKENVFFATYDDKNYKWNATIEGAQSSGSFKTGDFIKKPFYDNASVYYVLRAPIIKSDSLTFGFNIPFWSENKMTSVNSGITQKAVAVKCPYRETEIECYGLQIAVNQQTPPSGKPIQFYYSKAPLACEGGEINRAVVKIVEGDCTFTLKSLTTVV